MQLASRLIALGFHALDVQLGVGGAQPRNQLAHFDPIALVDLQLDDLPPTSGDTRTSVASTYPDARGTALALPFLQASPPASAATTDKRVIVRNCFNMALYFASCRR